MKTIGWKTWIASLAAVAALTAGAILLLMPREEAPRQEQTPWGLANWFSLLVNMEPDPYEAVTANYGDILTEAEFARLHDAFASGPSNPEVCIRETLADGTQVLLILAPLDEPGAYTIRDVEFLDAPDDGTGMP